MLWRLPFGATSKPWPPAPPEARATSPSLQARFDDLDQALLARFTAHDQEALRAQVAHRRFQLALAVGVALTSFFGALQAVMSHARWVGVLIAVAGLASTAIANQQQRQAALARYLRERAKAEELRSLYFSYLSNAPGISRRELEAMVAAISEPIAPTVGAVP